MSQAAIRGYHKLCFSTLIAVFVLILAGGVVRTTGSGMGCPDWPKCFGTWVPPTSIDQLPSDYKKTFSEYRERKNQKFATYLNAIGLTETADELLSNKTILEEADFNASKTWIEYVNRLLGVIVGFLILALAVKSVSLRKVLPKVFYFSMTTLLAVIVQGWFGSIVVSTNLTTWTITVHMFLALLIVALLVYVYHMSDYRDDHRSIDHRIRWILLTCIAALLIQIFWGTQVRQAIDRIASSFITRDSWISQLGLEFIIHRSLSWIVLGLHVVLVVKITKTSGDKTLPIALIVLILGTLLSGTGMAYFSVPYMLQPVHLLLGTMIFGAQLLLFFRLNTDRVNVLL